ncbi:unnamed protein product [Polarella glacialis]|uniref:Uncharacterized protein n=1 Tax=Polarella glacialis TaxID=89957 RepID=A0A813DGV2_POLGL|nr:unnamed protein product [Polarella glacialis]
MAQPGRPAGAVVMVAHCPQQGGMMEAGLLALPAPSLVPALPPKPPPQGDFARECLAALEAVPCSDPRPARSGLLQAASRYDNTFEEGRHSLLRALSSQAEVPGRARQLGGSAWLAEAVMPAIWHEFQAASAEAAVASSASPQAAEHSPEKEGFQTFLAEMLAGAVRTHRCRPDAEMRRAAAAEWKCMSEHERMFYAAVASQRNSEAGVPAADADPAPSVARSPAAFSGRPELRPEILARAPPSAEIYGSGPDAAFRHPFVKSLLDLAQRRVAFGAPWVLCVRTFGRSGLSEGEENPSKPGFSLMDTTMHTLKGLGVLRDPELLQRVHIFVAHDDPHFVSRRYDRALGKKLSERMIVGVRGADLQVRFIEECFARGQHVVVCDDNIVWLQGWRPDGKNSVGRFAPLRSAPCELDQVIRTAAEEMARQGAHLWGISPTNNLRFFHPSGQLRLLLGLVFGAFFGFIALHERELYTKHGQVKDDLERSLRYWDRDRVVLRFTHYACRKTHKPGAFNTKKGGISSSLKEEAHRAESTRAVETMARGFARFYVRLPRASDKQVDPPSGPSASSSPGVPAGKWKATVSDCGVVFCGRQATARHDKLSGDGPPKGTKLLSGYQCRQCRKLAASERQGRPRWQCCCVQPVLDEALNCFVEEGLAGIDALVELAAAAGAGAPEENAEAPSGSLAEQKLAQGAPAELRIAAEAVMLHQWLAAGRAEFSDYEALAAAQLRRAQWQPLVQAKKQVSAVLGRPLQKANKAQEKPQARKRSAESAGKALPAKKPKSAGSKEDTTTSSSSSTIWV